MSRLYFFQAAARAAIAAASAAAAARVQELQRVVDTADETVNGHLLQV